MNYYTLCELNIKLLDFISLLSPLGNVKKIVLCTGKIYYDLNQYREKNNIKDTAILRIEQISPFPLNLIKKYISAYKKYKKIIWAQEENKNGGYWSYVSSFELPNIKLVSRKTSSSPSTGFLKIHLKEQNNLIKKVFK